MKETMLVMVVIGASVALCRLNVPTERERQVAQWQRRVLKEQEQMTRDLLTMRDDINQKLENIKGMESGDLRLLRLNIENEHRNLQHSVLEITMGTNRDTWGTIRRRTLQTIRGVRNEYLRFQEKADRVTISMEKNE